MRGMQQEGQNRKRAARILVCLLVSLILHVALAALCLRLPAPERNRGFRPPRRDREEPRMIQLLRPAARPEQENQRPFAKTAPDQPEEKPQQADFEGARNNRASGESEEKTSDAPVPTMKGEEKEEIVTFDQERQDGDVEADGKMPPAPPSPPPVPPGASTPDDRKEEVSPSPPLPQEPTPDKQEPTPNSRRPAPEGESSDLNLHLTKEQALTAPDATPPDFSPKGVPIPPAVVPYDPSLADHAQPGFRSHERRSRSTGRFVLGRHPSLNVTATPRGKYEELIYRRIARYWYIACDEHRGDIIPGSLTISLRLDRKGRLSSMELVNRRGASVIQQSFTFGAIRRADLPPMPPQVQAGLVGDLLELIFEFHFD